MTNHETQIALNNAKITAALRDGNSVTFYGFFSKKLGRYVTGWYVNAME